MQTVPPDSAGKRQLTPYIAHVASILAMCTLPECLTSPHRVLSDQSRCRKAAKELMGTFDKCETSSSSILISAVVGPACAHFCPQSCRILHYACTQSPSSQRSNRVPNWQWLRSGKTHTHQPSSPTEHATCCIPCKTCPIRVHHQLTWTLTSLMRACLPG